MQGPLIDSTRDQPSVQYLRRRAAEHGFHQQSAIEEAAETGALEEAQRIFAKPNQAVPESGSFGG
jgi:hypothetical protein